MQITSPVHRLGVAVLRVAVGIILLWAGLEKLLGAGPNGWSAAGFLKFGTAGTLGWPFVSGEPAEGTIFNPTHDFWVGLAGNDAAMGIVNFLVVFGETALGIALILGILTRLSAALSALMMFLFFLAAWDFQFGIVNQHLTYMVVYLAVAGLGAGKYYGLDGMLAERGVAADRPWLRKWFLSGDPAEPIAA